MFYKLPEGREDVGVMARRFVIGENPEGRFLITGEEAHHIAVLRHKVGDVIQVNDKMCRIEELQRDEVRCEVVGEAELRGIPETKITLFQALLKSDKMEFVIQKSVELGVSSIIPFSSKNVVVKLDGKDKVKKVERWQKISVEASKQCGRSDIVSIGEVVEFREMLALLNDYDLVLLAYENETENLKKILKERSEDKKIAIIIGAEGGFDVTEVEQIVGQGEKVKSISLGERILRAETASLCMLSILMYEYES